MAFGYKNWDLYKAALELRGLVSRIARSAQRGLAEDVRHLRGASSSILFNLGEGYGQFMPGKKKEHYRIALGSTHECDMALTVLEAEMPTNRDVKRARELCDRIAAMLTNLIKSVETRRIRKDEPAEPNSQGDARAPEHPPAPASAPAPARRIPTPGARTPGARTRDPQTPDPQTPDLPAAN